VAQVLRERVQDGDKVGLPHSFKSTLCASVFENGVQPLVRLRTVGERAHLEQPTDDEDRSAKDPLALPDPHGRCRPRRVVHDDARLRPAHHGLLRRRVGNPLAVVRNVDVPDDGEKGGVDGSDEVVDRKEVGIAEGLVSVLLCSRGGQDGEGGGNKERSRTALNRPR
jgi:hypothetical protein